MDEQSVTHSYTEILLSTKKQNKTVYRALKKHERITHLYFLVNEANQENLLIVEFQ